MVKSLCRVYIFYFTLEKGKDRKDRKQRRGIGRNQTIFSPQIENSNVWGM
jgi:hypothetical protein